MPTLHSMCQSIRIEIPNIKVRVFSNGGGGATPNPWHVLGVDCLLHEDWDNMPNEVMVQVAAYSLTSKPALQAVVMWDYSFDVEAKLFAQAVPFSDEAIQMIESSLSSLEKVLREAVLRGTPSKMQ